DNGAPAGGDKFPNLTQHIIGVFFLVGRMGSLVRFGSCCQYLFPRALFSHYYFNCRIEQSGDFRMNAIPLNNRPSVAVIGLGYIGLPTAAILASSGAEVVGVDINQNAVDLINAGQVPFVEPDMATTVAGVVSQGYLRATTQTPHADNYIVAVPTPFKDGHEPDLSY